MEWPIVAVQDPPIWFKQCTINIHKAHKARSGNSEDAGNLKYPVLRRHATQHRSRALKGLTTALELLTGLCFIVNLEKNITTLGQLGLKTNANLPSSSEIMVLTTTSHDVHVQTERFRCQFSLCLH